MLVCAVSTLLHVYWLCLASPLYLPQSIIFHWVGCPSAHTSIIICCRFFYIAWLAFMWEFVVHLWCLLIRMCDFWLSWSCCYVEDEDFRAVMEEETPARKALVLIRSRLCDPNFLFRPFSDSADSNLRYSLFCLSCFLVWVMGIWHLNKKKKVLKLQQVEVHYFQFYYWGQQQLRSFTWSAWLW